MTYTAVGKAATDRYRKKFDLLQIRVEQGGRDRIMEHAKKHGESMNVFVNRAINETISRDNSESPLSEGEQQ